MTLLQELANRVAGGDPLRLEDAPAILATHDLITVGAMADDVRRGLHGAATTFVRVFEMYLGAIPAALRPHVEPGELRIIGCPATHSEAVEAVAAARRLSVGGIPLTGFSLGDLAALETSWPDLFENLACEGLDAVAEVAVDGRGAAAAVVDRARGAGLRVERLTVHAPAADPLPAISAALELQQSVGGFKAFAPLPRTFSAAAPSTGYDDVKAVALARLLTRAIPSVQVDWPLYGPKLAQVALTVGADDVDGVPAGDTGALGPRRSALGTIVRNIRAAGLEPIERNGRYETAGGVPQGARP